MKRERRQLLTDIDMLQLERHRFEYAPSDIYFAEDGLPVHWEPVKKKPYGDYTVYLSRRSNIYHKDSYCAPYDAEIAHIFIASAKARPCRKCAACFRDNFHIPSWFSGESE